MKFGFLRNKDKYSKKELITNYVICFGWLIGGIIGIIVGSWAFEWSKSIASGKIAKEPRWMQPSYSVAFIFIFSSIVAMALKTKYAHQRKKGKLLSINEEKRRISK